MMGLQLRRGDRLFNYPKHCADAGVVLKAVKDVKTHGPNCTKTTHVFVATDEENKAYIKELREGLATVFAAVHWETEIPQLKEIAEDNYLVYIVDEELIHTATCMLHYHPTEGVRKYCPN